MKRHIMFSRLNKLRMDAHNLISSKWDVLNASTGPSNGQYRLNTVGRHRISWPKTNVSGHFRWLAHNITIRTNDHSAPFNWCAKYCNLFNSGVRNSQISTGRIPGQQFGSSINIVTNTIFIYLRQIHNLYRQYGFVWYRGYMNICVLLKKFKKLKLKLNT